MMWVLRALSVRQRDSPTVGRIPTMPNVMLQNVTVVGGASSQSELPKRNKVSNRRFADDKE